MPVPSIIIIPKKILSPIGYSPANVTHKDVIAMQGSDLTYFASKDYHIKMTLPSTLTLTSPYNSLNSHIVTRDFPQKL
jgi:hypothetical protein